MSLAGGSLGLFFLLLLAGDLGGEGSVLQLEASQRVFEVHLTGSMVALELQSRQGLRGRGLMAQLGLAQAGVWRGVSTQPT